MRIAKQDTPATDEAPGAVCRQKMNFDAASGYGEIGGEYFSLAAGSDLGPLLQPG